MICEVSFDDVVDAIQIHWQLQLGSYFKSVYDIGGAIYNLGGRVKDYYWNYAGLIHTSHSEQEKLISNAIRFAETNNCVPAFYIDPTVTPKEFVNAIKKRGFTPEDEEIWMFFNPNFNIDLPSPKDLRIETVKTSYDMQVFVDVFNRSFELLDDGKKNSDYGLSLQDAFENKPEKVEIVHFIGWIDHQPVSVASAYIHENVGGIYNVGTPEEFRSHGYGAALSLAAIREVTKQNYRRLLLQTEIDSGPERLYKKLGFERAFSAAIWSMAE